MDMFDASLTNYEDNSIGSKIRMILSQTKDIDKIVYKIDEPTTIDFYNTDGTKIGTLNAPTGTQTLTVSYKNVKEVVLNGTGVMWVFNFEMYGVTSTGLPIFPPPNEPLESDTPLPKVDVWNQFKEVSKSLTHTLVVTNSGDLYAWGENNFGQLGNGTTANSLTPILISAIKNVKKVSTGNGYSLAMTDDGKIWSWGNNDSSQLGRIATTGTPSALVPGEIPEVSGATVIEANAFAIPSKAHSAFIKNGDIYTVGNGEKGKLGTGSINNQSAITMTTLKSKTQVYTTSGDIIGVSLGSDYMLFYNTDAVLYGVGGNDTYQIAQPDAFSHRLKGVDYYNPVLQSLEPVNLKAANGGVNSITQVSAGAKHSNAKQTNIQLIWGLSSDGQAYDSFTTKKIATAIKTGMLQIQSGMYNSYILQADKTVASWGKNDKGQLGIVPTASSFATNIVEKNPGSPLTNIKKIDDSIALAEDNKIWSWGTYPGNGTVSSNKAILISPINKELEMIVEQGELINNARQIKITLKNSYSTTMVKISPDSHLKSFFRSAGNGRVIKMPVAMENGDLVFNTTINTSGIHTIYSTDTSDVEQRQEINVIFGPISQPTFLSPVNESYNRGEQINLSWGGSTNVTGGIIQYELSLTKDNGSTWEIIKPFGAETTGTFTPTITDLTNEAKFRVRAKNDTGDISTYLEGNIFRIENFLLTKVTEVETDKMRVYDDEMISLNWIDGVEELDADIEYIIYYKNDSEQYVEIQRVTNIKEVNIQLMPSYFRDSGSKAVFGVQKSKISNGDISSIVDSNEVFLETLPLNNLTTDKEFIIPRNNLSTDLQAIFFDFEIDYVGQNLDDFVYPYVKWGANTSAPIFGKPVNMKKPDHLQLNSTLEFEFYDTNPDYILFDWSLIYNYISPVYIGLSSQNGVTVPSNEKRNYYEIYAPFFNFSEDTDSYNFTWTHSQFSNVLDIIEVDGVEVYRGSGTTFDLPKAGMIGNEEIILYTLKDGKKQRVDAKYLSATRVNELKTFGNINFGEVNLSGSRTIKAISTDEEMLKFTQYTNTPQGYSVNMTFSPFNSNTGNTISSSNLKINKMTRQTDIGNRISGEFTFQDNIPKQLLNIDTYNAKKINSYTIEPEDIELTIPTDFIPSSNSSEEFISTITYSVVIVP